MLIKTTVVFECTSTFFFFLISVNGKTRMFFMRIRYGLRKIYFTYYFPKNVVDDPSLLLNDKIKSKNCIEKKIEKN